MTAVIWSAQAAKDLASIQPPSRRVTIQKKITKFAEDGHGDVKKMVGAAAGYRLRVGDYRVRFDVDHDAEELHILQVFCRQKGY